MNDRIYCSIDLELSGFDTAKDEILEVGFVLFKLGKAGFDVVEEWSQVFKPHTEVRHKILGLTGIKEEELANAPEFKDYREFLSEKLSGVTLVGHGITMDIKFLEAFGVPCPPHAIDTLELVQWLLPTHHSYNLENVMHYLGLSHEEAHRALADSKAVLHLVERMLGIFVSLPESVQKQIRSYIENKNLAWEHLLDVSLPANPAPIEKIGSLSFPIHGSELQPNRLTIVPVQESLVRQTVSMVPKNQRVILSVPNKATTLSLWKHGVVEGYFSAKDSFDETKFTTLQQSFVDSKELLLFVIKILVWKATNWQTKTILDLNLSFSGSQFKSLITQDANEEVPDSQLVCMDHSTAIKLAKTGLMPKRWGVICDLLSFERTLADSSGVRLSWYRALGVLRAIYNPETETGLLSYRDAVMDALGATDLFFGLVALTLQQLKHSSPLIDVSELREQDTYRYEQIYRASVNYIKKLGGLAKEFSDVAAIGKEVERFFEVDEQQGVVRWIEYGDARVSFHGQPLELSSETQRIIPSFSAVSATDTIQDPEVVAYMLARLGLGGMGVTHEVESKNSIATYELFEAVPDSESLRERIKVESLPLLLIFPTLVELKRFYDEHYKSLQAFASVYAEKYSGGTNKLFRNYALRKNTILLVTQETLVRAKNHQVHAQSVILTNSAASPSTHPYESALQRYWSKQFPNFSSLYGVLRLHDILSRLAWMPSGKLQVFGVTNESRNALAEFFGRNSLTGFKQDIHRQSTE